MAIPLFHWPETCAANHMPMEQWRIADAAEQEKPDIFGRILVPLDGTPSSSAIIPWVCRVFFRTDPELFLVRAARPPPALYAEGNYESPLALATADLLRVEERLSDLGLRARVVVRVGSPARVILETAFRERVSLIAMSTHGRKGVARFVFGSVTEEVLRLSPVPLLLVGPGPSRPRAGVTPQEEQPIRTLLVPVDAGEDSLSILPHAASIAKLTGARVVLLQVFETEARRQPHALSARTPDRFDFDRLRHVSQTMHAEGIEIHALVEHGDPRRVILESCRLLGADMIAMATRGRSGIRRWMGGSVTESILREASVPLLVVRFPKVPPAVHQRSRRTVASGHQVALEVLRRGP